MIVLRRFRAVEVLGLLLALLGFETRIAEPALCPLDPLENLRAACETAI